MLEYHVDANLKDWANKTIMFFPMPVLSLAQLTHMLMITAINPPATHSFVMLRDQVIALLHQLPMIHPSTRMN